MRGAYRFLLASLVFLALTTGSFAFDVPALKARVNDYAALLTEPVRESLEGALRALEEKTTAQVVILTVKDMQGEDDKSFALKVGEKWKVGQKGKDNGLILLYTVKEDKYRIEVGYGLEGAIPDGVAGDVIRQQLRKKADPKKGIRDFDGAFQDAVLKVSGIISAEFEKDPTGKSMEGSKLPDGDTIWFILIAAVFVAGIFGMAHTIAGGVAGCLEGILIAWWFALGGPMMIVLAVAGFIIGLMSPFFVEAALSGDGSSSLSGGSSGRSSRGFSGGGGRFGGGGASG